MPHRKFARRRLTLWTLSLLLLSSQVIATNEDSDPNDNDQGQDEQTGCAPGALLNSAGQCEECVTSPDNCYSSSKCVYDTSTFTKACTCADGYLSIADNRDDSCRFCQGDDQCHLGRTCVKYGEEEAICGVECSADTECSSRDPNTRCRTPPQMAIYGNDGDQPRVCWCVDGFYRVPEGICARKPNISEYPLSCYSCGPGEDCAAPPYGGSVQCEPGEVCFSEARIADWSAIVYGEIAPINFRRAEVQRGCVSASKFLIYQQQVQRKKSEELWQNCAVEGKEVVCRWTCDSPMCNWYTNRPVLRVHQPEEQDTLTLILAMGLMLIIFLVIVFLGFKLVASNVQQLEQGDRAQIVKSGDAAGENYGSTQPPEE